MSVSNVGVLGVEKNIITTTSLLENVHPSGYDIVPKTKIAYDVFILTVNLRGRSISLMQE